MQRSGTSAWIEANGISHRYLLEGPPSGGPLLVLVNEMGGTLEGWDRMMPALLGAGFQVLRYDMRQSGLSERCRAVFGFEDLAEDLAQLCAALDLPAAAAVLGCAFGGAVALSLVAHHPARACSVLAMAPAVGVPPERRAAVLARAEMLEREGLRPSQDARLSAPWPESARPDPAVFLDFWLRRVAGDPATIAAQLRVLANADLTADLARIACPVTLLSGRFDEERPTAVVTATAAGIGPHGAPVRVVDSGHFMSFQSPDLVVRELQAHLASLPRA